MQQSDTLHVMDNRSRLALVRVGASPSNDTSPPVKYQLGDHLGSCNVVVGGADASASAFIDREEYTPYGETSFGSFARKRYRFTGKERDEESGLAYHGARYCLAWLGRWASCDPLGPVDGLNLYAYARNCPVLLTDPGGTDADVDLDLQAPDVGTDINTEIPPTSGTGRDFSLETDGVTIEAGDGVADPAMLDELARSPSDAAAPDPKSKAEPEDPPREVVGKVEAGEKVEKPRGHPAKSATTASQSLTVKGDADGGKELIGEVERTRETTNPPSPVKAGKTTDKVDLSVRLGVTLHDSPKSHEKLKLNAGPLFSFQVEGTAGAQWKGYLRGKAELEYEKKNLFIKPLKLSLTASLEAGGGGNAVEGGIEATLEYTWINTEKNIQFGVVGGFQTKYSPLMNQDPMSTERSGSASAVFRF